MPVLTRAATLPVRSAAPASPAVADRFARARVSPALAQALAHTPPDSFAALEAIVPLLVGGAGLALAMGLTSGASPPMRVVAALVGLAWFGLLAWTAARLTRAATASLERHLVLVVDTHDQLRGGGQTRIRATHHVVVQDEHGVRAKFRCPEPLVGLITVGDVGVAFLRGRRLVELVRLDV